LKPSNAHNTSNTSSDRSCPYSVVLGLLAVIAVVRLLEWVFGMVEYPDVKKKGHSNDDTLQKVP